MNRCIVDYLGDVEMLARTMLVACSNEPFPADLTLAVCRIYFPQGIFFIADVAKEDEKICLSDVWDDSTGLTAEELLEQHIQHLRDLEEQQDE